MFENCCESEWMCPTNSSEPEFSVDSRSKPFTPIAKHSASTGLYEASTTASPESGGSGFKQSEFVDQVGRVSTRTEVQPTLIESVHRSRRADLDRLNAMIASRQRSCSVLTMQVQWKERTLGNALLTTTANFRALNTKYQQQMRQLDRMEQAIVNWQRNRNRQRHSMERPLRQPTRQ